MGQPEEGRELANWSGVLMPQRLGVPEAVYSLTETLSSPQMQKPFEA